MWFYVNLGPAPSTLEMEATCSSVTSVSTYNTTKCQNSVDSKPEIRVHSITPATIPSGTFSKATQELRFLLKWLRR